MARNKRTNRGETKETRVNDSGGSNILSREFSDKPSLALSFFVWSTIFCFIVSFWLLVVKSYDYPDFKFGWELIALGSLSVLLLLPLDRLNIAGFDVPINPIYKFVNIKLWIAWIGSLILFYFLPYTLTGQSVVDSAIGYGYLSVDSIITAMSVAQTKTDQLVSLTLVTLQIPFETFWFNMIPFLIAKKILDTIKKFTPGNLIIWTGVTTFLLFLPLAVLYTGIIAPVFHWEAHNISLDNLGNAIPSAFLFSLWGIGMLFFGVPFAILGHFGWNTSVSGFFASTTAEPVTGAFAAGLMFFFMFVKKEKE